MISQLSLIERAFPKKYLTQVIDAVCTRYHAHAIVPIVPSVSVNIYQAAPQKYDKRLLITYF